MEALQGYGYDHLILKLEWAKVRRKWTRLFACFDRHAHRVLVFFFLQPNTKDPSAATEFRSGYGKALAQDTKEKVSYASNLTK